MNCTIESMEEFNKMNNKSETIKKFIHIKPLQLGIKPPKMDMKELRIFLKAREIDKNNRLSELNRTD